jgi:hypothetical protein
LGLLASELAGPADCVTTFPRRFFGWLLVKSSALHLAKNTFTLHLLLKYAKGLIDVVVANEYLQETFPSCCSSDCFWMKRHSAGLGADELIALALT